MTTLPALFFDGWVAYDGEPGSTCGFQWTVSSRSFYVPVTLINFVIPSSVIVYANIRVFYTARKQQRKVFAIKPGSISPERAEMPKSVDVVNRAS